MRRLSFETIVDRLRGGENSIESYGNDVSKRISSGIDWKSVPSD